jgi:hypothetical protein
MYQYPSLRRQFMAEGILFFEGGLLQPLLVSFVGLLHEQPVGLAESDYKALHIMTIGPGT